MLKASGTRFPKAAPASEGLALGGGADGRHVREEHEQRERRPGAQRGQREVCGAGEQVCEHEEGDERRQDNGGIYISR